MQEGSLCYAKDEFWETRLLAGTLFYLLSLFNVEDGFDWLFTEVHGPNDT